MYEETQPHEFSELMEDPYLPPEETQPEMPSGIISTSQAINLTCTLASLSALFALFLCFADQRSKAVRRFSIQSVGLGIIHIGLGLGCWLVSALLGWIPVLGYVLFILLALAFVAVSVFFLVLRVRMMLHAYRGEAYVLPVFGQKLRRFE